MTITLEPLGPRHAPAIWAAAGAAVYELTAAGDVLRAFTPFPDAGTVPVRLATSPGVLLVGAGEGGSPRLSAFGMAGLVEEWSVFVGDPASRDGVNVATFDSPLRATANATLPPTAAQLQRAQATADRYDPAYLPPALVVDVFGGSRVTQLPEWSHLAGVATPGHPGGTYDSAVGVATPGGVWVAGEFAYAVGHELGHAAHYHLGLVLTPQEQEEFADAFAFTGTP